MLGLSGRFEAACERVALRRFPSAPAPEARQRLAPLMGFTHSLDRTRALQDVRRSGGRAAGACSFSLTYRSSAQGKTHEDPPGRRHRPMAYGFPTDQPDPVSHVCDFRDTPRADVELPPRIVADKVEGVPRRTLRKS